ncbi:MAG: HEAT repeat domain-containing protein [Patescibacteria group bacterium]
MRKEVNPRAVAFIKQLKSWDPHLRKSAAEELGELHDLRAIPPLILALKDEDRGVRIAVVKALGNIDDPKVTALLPLCNALKAEQNSEVKEKMIEAIKELYFYSKNRFHCGRGMSNRSGFEGLDLEQILRECV